MQWKSAISAFFRIPDPGSDEAYAAAEHEFPTAMGAPIAAGASQADQAQFVKLNDELLERALRHSRELV
jgi:hypothetical protein